MLQYQNNLKMTQALKHVLGLRDQNFWHYLILQKVSSEIAIMVSYTSNTQDFEQLKINIYNWTVLSTMLIFTKLSQPEHKRKS